MVPCPGGFRAPGGELPCPGGFSFLPWRVSGFLEERCRMKEGCRRIVRSTLLDAETLLHEPENPPARAALPRKSRTLVTLVRLFLSELWLFSGEAPLRPGPGRGARERCSVIMSQAVITEHHPRPGHQPVPAGRGPPRTSRKETGTLHDQAPGEPETPGNPRRRPGFGERVSRRVAGSFPCGCRPRRAGGCRGSEEGFRVQEDRPALDNPPQPGNAPPGTQKPSTIMTTTIPLTTTLSQEHGNRP